MNLSLTLARFYSLIFRVAQDLLVRTWLQNGKMKTS